MGLTSTTTRCTATTKTGAPCNGWRVGGSLFCLSHDPEHAAAVAESRRAGGRARHGRIIGPIVAPERVELNDMESVLSLLETCANDAMGLENSLGRVRAVTGVCLAWAKVFETSELERRLAALEARLANGNG